ncbi:MAG: hypothetical protein LBS36_06950 [Oscillospiraceae bacterium]|jgi:hypothetical protein|nr:hypothetical protein [Oscillospiraceae bacterium]
MKNKKMRAMAHARKTKIFYITAFLFAFMVALVATMNAESIWQPACMAGMSMATMALIGDIEGVSDRITAGSQISAKVWLVHVDSQLNTDVPFPVPNANRQLGTIPLKTGEIMHYFIAIDDSITDTSKGDKGDVTTNVTNTISFIMGGNRDQLLQFYEEHAGGRFIIIYQLSSDKKYYVMGNDVKPMILKNYERKNDKDSRSITFTFENKSFDQPYYYVGDIVRGAPAVIATDATTLTIQSGKSVYNTPSNNTAAKILDDVAGIADADKGRMIDIIGTGGAYPLSIESSEVFLLIDKETWTANAGSRISFKVLDPITLVEVEGSRVQTA